MQDIPTPATMEGNTLPVFWHLSRIHTAWRVKAAKDYFSSYPHKERKSGVAPVLTFPQKEEHTLWYRGFSLIYFTAFLLLDKSIKSTLEWLLFIIPQKVKLNRRGASRHIWANVTTPSPQLNLVKSPLPWKKALCRSFVGPLKVFVAPYQNICSTLAPSFLFSVHPYDAHIIQTFLEQNTSVLFAQKPRMRGQINQVSARPKHKLREGLDNFLGWSVCLFLLALFGFVVCLFSLRVFVTTCL